MYNRNYSQKILRALYIKSGNRCAFPGCGKPLLSGNSYIGEIAHICALNKGGARYNPSLGIDYLNSIDNLVLLCRNHHKEIDDNPEKYTEEYLRNMKMEHENHVENLAYNIHSGLFYQELNGIFGKYDFDNIMSQNFTTPFPAAYIDSLEYGLLEIRHLLNDDVGLLVGGRVRGMVSGVISGLEYVLTAVSMISNSVNNNSGFNMIMLIPKFPDPSDRDIMIQRMGYIRQIYSQLRYHN